MQPADSVPQSYAAAEHAAAAAGRCVGAPSAEGKRRQQRRRRQQQRPTPDGWRRRLPLRTVSHEGWLLHIDSVCKPHHRCRSGRRSRAGGRSGGGRGERKVFCTWAGTIHASLGGRTCICAVWRQELLPSGRSSSGAAARPQCTSWPATLSPLLLSLTSWHAAVPQLGLAHGRKGSRHSSGCPGRRRSGGSCRPQQRSAPWRP